MQTLKKLKILHSRFSANKWEKMKDLFSNRVALFHSTTFVLLLGVLIPFATSLPMLQTYSQTGAWDWDMVLMFLSSVHRSIYHYAQLPFWNPWCCGGNDLWANPQVPIISFTYLFSPFLSMSLAAKIDYVFLSIISTIGMILIGRNIFQIKNPIFILLGSLAFTLSSTHALHFLVGHFSFGSFFLYPLGTYFYLQSIRLKPRKSILFASCIFSLIVYRGGISSIPYVLLPVVLSLFLSIFALRLKVLQNAILIGFFTICFSAPKLVPTWFFMNAPSTVDLRQMPEGESNSLNAIYDFFVRRVNIDQISTAGTEYPLDYGWYEYGTYIGFFPLLLVGLGCVVICREFLKRRRFTFDLLLPANILLIGGVVLGASFAGGVLYDGLESVPLYDNVRVLGRFLIPLTFVFSLVLFRLFKYIERHRFHRFVVLPITVAAVISCLDISAVNSSLLVGGFKKFPHESPALLSRNDEITLDWKTSPWQGYLPMASGIGAGRSMINAYDPFQTKKSLIRSNDLADKSTTEILFGPSAITLSHRGKVDPNISLVLNQNYKEGWFCNGAPAKKQAGGGMVCLNTKSAPADFFYTPNGLWLGVILLVIGAISSLILL